MFDFTAIYLYAHVRAALPRMRGYPAQHGGGRRWTALLDAVRTVRLTRC